MESAVSRSLPAVVDCLNAYRIGPLPLLHAHCLEHGIHRISVEPRLELGEQLAGNRRDVLHARHRQKDAFGSGVEGDLQ